MSTLAEIEVAVTQLTPAEQEQLHAFLGERLAARPKKTGLSPEEIEAWLQASRGVGIPGMTTEKILDMTRGEE